MDTKKSTGNRAKPARISDYIVYAIYRTFEFCLRLFPIEIVCLIGSLLGHLGYYLLRQRRGIVIRNLRIAYSDQLNLRQLKALARQTFRNTGLNLLASVCTSSLDTQEINERVEIQGADNLLDAYAEGYGCILLLAHMGNWELLSQLSGLIPDIKTPASLYRPLNNPLLDRLIKRRRESRGTELFSRRDGFSKPITNLRQNGILGVIADQSAGKHGIPVAFFGKLTSMTNLPALLHRKTKAPILPISMCTVSLGKWKVVIHPPIKITEENRKNTYQITTQCAAAYQKVMNESPADVLWMHNYWRGGKRTALKLRGQAPRNINRMALQFSKPFYILIFTGDTITKDQLSDTLTYLRTCRPDLNITLLVSYLELPQANHYICVDTQEPPHLTVNAIRNLEQSMPTPFDCALDLSMDGSGAALIKQAGIPYIFSLASPPNLANKHNANSTDDYQTRLDAFIHRVSPPPPSK